MANQQKLIIPEGQFALVQCEVRTGIVLGLDGKRHVGQGVPMLVFDSLTSATEKAKEIIRLDPEVECGIYDDQNQSVSTLRDESHVAFIMESARKLREEKHR